MADEAEKAFLAFVEQDLAAPKPPSPNSSSTHLLLDKAVASHTQSQAESSPTGMSGQPSAPAPSHHLLQPASALSALEQHQTAQAQPACDHKPATATNTVAAGQEEASSSTGDAQVWAAPPAELTVKHVGFLGSLAHALVHLHMPAEGLALLRTAASVMRSNPPAHPLWFHHASPDPQVLHAHVLMDLV